MNRIKELQDFIGSQQSEITEIDESLIRKMIQQITVSTTTFPSGSNQGLRSTSTNKSRLAVWELLKAGTCCSGIYRKYDVAPLPSVISATLQNTLN